jgi:hypothetical protein
VNSTATAAHRYLQPIQQQQSAINKQKKKKKKERKRTERA